MAKATRSVAKRKRHKKWIKRAKGFRGRRNSVFKLSKEAVLKAGQYAYRDRRKKKTQIRTTWQIKINAAARQHDISYSRFINGLRKNNIELDRKVLADLAQDNPEIFNQVVEKIKEKV